MIIRPGQNFVNLDGPKGNKLSVDHALNYGLGGRQKDYYPHLIHGSKLKRVKTPI